jgi:IS30 family transposase
MITSKQLAKELNKPHNRILQDIRRKLKTHQYKLSSYLDKQMKQRIMYVFDDKLKDQFIPTNTQIHVGENFQLTVEQQQVLADYILLARQHLLYGEDIYDCLKIKYTNSKEFGKIKVLDYLIKLEHLTYKRPQLKWI